ncbi:hypothetical protein HMI54_012504 [Coelomomyces lativittatus]|nr:hypothetical protein HMI54_012504 [Coelomomyces lativittatus]
MGINRMIPFLKNHAPNSYYRVELEKFKGLRFAFDGTLLLYKYWFANPSEEFVLFKVRECAHLLRKHDIHAIFVFDGTIKSKPKIITQFKRAHERSQIKKRISQAQLVKQIFENESTTRSTELLTGFLSKHLSSTSISTKNLIKYKAEDESYMDVAPMSSSNAADSLCPAEASSNLKFLQSVFSLTRSPPKSKLDKLISKYDPATLPEFSKNLEVEIERLSRTIQFPPKDLFTKVRWELFHQSILSIVTPNMCEAEQVCGALVHSGVADMVVTDDTDAMVFYPVPVLRQWTSGKLHLVHPNFLSELELSFSMFKELCILSGSDFSGKIYGLGPFRAYKLILKYESIENILKHRPDLEVTSTFDPINA